MFKSSVKLRPDDFRMQSLLPRRIGSHVLLPDRTQEIIHRGREGTDPCDTSLESLAEDRPGPCLDQSGMPNPL